MNRDRLIEVLSVPTYFGKEDRMISYISSVLDEKQLDYTVDRIGNIYVTKGDSKRYPCFVSHTDTVHQVNERLEVYQNPKGHLQGRDSVDHTPLGVGGDDKCGVYLCLEMLDQLDNVKVAFFVGEEFGMVGSREACPEFFSNVKYAIQFDSPEGDSMSLTLRGLPLFDVDSKFGKTVTPLILEKGITKWQRHPYTDVYQLITKFNFPCLNLAAGYHRYHTQHEYVVIEEVENVLQLALELVEVLVDNDYMRIKSYSVVTQ
jgi:putative aminopeptidase FrvX